MATKVVSNAGGNYNAGGTWVGGVVPLTTDDIAFTATSGNLNVNTAAFCAGVNFTNYVGTLAVNTAFIINGNINIGTGGYNVSGSNTMYAGATNIITSNGTAWKGNFGFFGNSQTYTLADDLTINGTLTFNVSAVGTINGFNIYAKTNVQQLNFPVVGSTNLIFAGTGTWSFTTNAYIGLNITINTVGTITLGSNVYYGIGTFTYTTGTVITTNSTFNVRATCSLNCAGINFNSFALLGTSQTYTLLANLNISNTLFVNSVTSTIIAGSFGFTCGILTMGTTILTLPAGVVNTVTTSMNSLTATLATKALINCSTVGGTKAILNLLSGATQDNGYLSATDVDSSGGVTIWTYKGTLTREVNWNQLSTDPRKHVLKFGTKILKH